MQTSAKPQLSFFAKAKRIFIIGLVFSFVVAGIAGYFWYRNIMKTNQEVTMLLPKAEMFDTLNQAILSEQTRCHSFIGSGSGDFGQFEYCKRFLDWSAGIK